MKRTIPFLVLIMMSLISALNTYAQQTITIEGIVINENGKPLPNTNLRISTTLGTVSNSEGAFVLKFSGDLSKDSLLVSSIGYKSLKFPLSGVNTNLKIKLIPDVVH